MHNGIALHCVCNKAGLRKAQNRAEIATAACCEYRECEKTFLLVQGPEVLYAGIFLDAAARQKIMAAVPPAFSNVSADHVTLCYRPSTEWLCSLPLGALESLTISFEAMQDGIQVSCSIHSYFDLSYKLELGMLARIRNLLISLYEESWRLVVSRSSKGLS